MISKFLGVGWTDPPATTGNSTASGTNAGPDNLLTDRRSEFWRTANPVTIAFANIDLGQTRPINSVAVMDIVAPTDLSESVECRIRVADVEADLGTANDTILADGNVVPVLADGTRQFLYTGEMAGVAPVSARWVRVSIIVTPGVITQQLGASRVIIAGPGSEYVPDHGVSVGSEVVTPSSKSDVTETDSGSVFVRNLFTRRVAAPQLRFQKDASYLDPGGLWDLLAFAGSNRPIVFAQEADLDYEASVANAERISKQMLYGRVPNPDGARAESANHRSVTLDMEEWT